MIINWTAKRSGKSITIEGIEKREGKPDRPVKITRVEPIECIPGDGIFAIQVDQNGQLAWALGSA